MYFFNCISELCPESPSYYGNRAACYMMLSKYKEALEDSRKAVSLDSMFTKVRQFVSNSRLPAVDSELPLNWLGPQVLAGYHKFRILNTKPFHLLSRTQTCL